jgi:hypothetical protein
VVRAADPSEIEKGLKLLNGKMQQPVGRRFDPCRRRHYLLESAGFDNSLLYCTKLIGNWKTRRSPMAIETYAVLFDRLLMAQHTSLFLSGSGIDVWV